MALRRITSRQTTDQMINRLIRAFREKGRSVDRTLGHRGGAAPVDYFYAADWPGVWLGYHEIKNRHWCAFGTLPLPESGTVSITVEINPPLEGINRQIQGLFAADPDGNVFLCHAGGIGGGRKGVGQQNFLDWLGRDRDRMVDPDGQHTLAFRVAQIGGPRMIEQIAEYVRAVADFKAGNAAPVGSTGSPAFDGSPDEFEGERKLPARESQTISCDHGIIRNRLADLIAATGREPRRDQQRDLIVGNPESPDAEFEIKTGSDPQSVYTAVGQLLVHHTRWPAAQCIAVLPEPVSAELADALASLEIDLVTYSWTETHIEFKGLRRIIPQADDRTPINPK